jgi:ribosome-binding factor A
MRKFAKSDKVADLLRHAVSNAFLGELEDPRLRWIIITEVQLSRDFSVAKLYYTVVAPNLGLQEAEAALHENLRRLRSYLGRNLRLKQTPELRFIFDETQEKAERIEALLRSLHRDTDE